MDQKFNTTLIISGTFIIVAAIIGYTIQVNAMTTAFAAGFSGNINLSTIPFYVSNSIGGFMVLLGITISCKKT